MTSPVVSMSEVTAGYGPVTVLREVDLQVHQGEVVALLGPNGAGKSTTLLTLCGVVTPTSGRVEVLGAEPPSPKRTHTLISRGVVHVPENRGIFAQLTTQENLRLGPGSARHAVAASLELFPELERLLDRRAGLLSGGEQQMVVLARALAAQPRVLLIDEMSLGLAPVIVERLLPYARAAADDGAAVLLVEQHTDLALGTADRAYVLVHGRVALAGSAADLLADRAALDAAFLS